jgi:hypothetical protein
LAPTPEAVVTRRVFISIFMLAGALAGGWTGRGSGWQDIAFRACLGGCLAVPLALLAWLKHEFWTGRRR